MASVQVISVDPVSRNLKRFLFQKHRHSAVFDTGIHGLTEYLLDVLRPGRSRNIPVLRLPCKNRIAYAAADGISLKAIPS